MTTLHDVSARVGQILVDHFLLMPQQLKATKTLEALDLNQWERLEVMYYLEHEFAIDLADDEVVGIQTVGDVVDTVYRHLQPVGIA